MNTPITNRDAPRGGFTLMEMTMVIMVLLALITTTTFFANNIGEWRRGKLASEALTEVYAAQRAFLADNPRRKVSSLTTAEVAGYLPLSPALPAVEDLDGNELQYDVTVTPPVLMQGGAPYDPSGSTTDSLWDVGK